MGLQRLSRRLLAAPVPMLVMIIGLADREEGVERQGNRGERQHDVAEAVAVERPRNDEAAKDRYERNGEHQVVEVGAHEKGREKEDGRGENQPQVGIPSARAMGENETDPHEMEVVSCEEPPDALHRGFRTSPRVPPVQPLPDDRRGGYVEGPRIKSEERDERDGEAGGG